MRLEIRVAALATVFALMFGALVTRLWVVQIAEGPVHVQKSQGLEWSETQTAAARGDIVDANGVVLATSIQVPGVVVTRSQIPSEVEPTVIQELAGVLGRDPGEIAELFALAGSGSTFTVDDVSPEVAYFIMTNRSRFPGVSIRNIPERVYPEGSFMAHVLGHVGRVSQDDLLANPDLDPNGTVGKLGVEGIYDETLQGEAGAEFYQVRPDGTPYGERRTVAATEGSTVQLTVDVSLQMVTERALADGIARAKTLKDADPERGAVVVLNAKTGEVAAMASFPSFDPSQFVIGLTQTEYELLRDSQAFNNLAIQGLYPPGSAMKAITYATAVEEGIYPNSAHTQTPNGSLECTGVLTANGLDDGSQKRFTDPGHGIVDLHEALGESCNIYFWEVALAIWGKYQGTDKENILQRYARSVGLGSLTGIDLWGERAGRVPDRELFEQWLVDAPALISETRKNGNLWVGGDLMNVAIGQGETLATPLQMAVAYGALANGGTVWKPRVVDRIIHSDGTVEELQSGIANQIAWSEQFESVFRDDLGRTTNNETGTAYAAFRSMANVNQVGGKTGTAQRAGNPNTAWFVGVAPLSDPEWIVSVVLEDGGGGGTSAAPVARQIYQYLFGEEIDPIGAGF